MKTKEPAALLPTSFIPVILNNLHLFEARVEGNSIIISVKEDGSVQVPQERRVAKVSPTFPTLQPPRAVRFMYRVVDKKITPESAARYGFSEQRLKVYRAIHSAGVTGVQSKDILTKTGLPHGTVQQILHWLRERQLVLGAPVE